jgi:rieske iron-sulfur protein
MAEESKEKIPPQTPDSQQKPATPAPPAARPVAAVPPKPVTPPPRPPTPMGAPAARPAVKDTGKRTLIKLLATAGVVLSFVPFVPWGKFLLSSVSSTGDKKPQLAVLDLNNSTNRNANGAAAGKTVNVNDLATFPPNGTWLLTYPSSGDITVDSQNPDTFQKFQLIRLPSELGGDQKSAAAFVGYSKVCVHLWCSPNYNPTQTKNPKENGYKAPDPNTITHQQYECPCHGSIYEIPDGKATDGPASLQPAPTNAIPMLTLTADSSGNLWIEKPVEDVDHNGLLGYGRNYQSYQNYILPASKGTHKQ